METETRATYNQLTPAQQAQARAMFPEVAPARCAFVVLPDGNLAHYYYSIPGQFAAACIADILGITARDNEQRERDRLEYNRQLDDLRQF